MKVITYNFYCRPKWLFPDNQLDRAKEFLASFKQYESINGQVDVIMFQELFDNDVYKIIKKTMMKLGFFYRTNRPNRKIFLNGGTAIFSRHPIMEKSKMSFPGGSVFNVASAKGMNYAKIEIDNKIYHFVNTHLDSFKPDERLRQMRIIKDFLDEKFIPKTEGIIIGGDWNIKMETEEIDNVSAVFKNYTIGTRKLFKNDKSKNFSHYHKNDWLARRSPFMEKKKLKSYWIDFFVYKNLDTKNKMKIVQLRSVNIQKAKKILYSTPFFFNFYNPFSKQKMLDMSDHYAVELTF